MNKELLTKLRYKQEAYKRWELGPLTEEEYGNTVKACRGKVRKAISHRTECEVMVRDVKGNKTGLCKYISSNREHSREAVCSLLKEAGDLVTKVVERAKVFDASFTILFTGKTGLQASWVPKTSGRI